jgi:hypothetical protein
VTAVPVLLLLVAVITGCGGEDGPSEDATRASTATNAAASPTFTSRRQASPVVPESTRAPATATTFSSFLVGRVRVDDPAADISGGANPEDDIPAGVDLLGVELDGDGTRLYVRWFAEERPPSQLVTGDLHWVVEVFDGEEHLYQLGIHLTSARMEIYSVDVATDERTSLRLASTFEDRIEALYPASVLPKIDGPFTWVATTTWTGPSAVTWTDVVPDGASATPASANRPSFP